MSDNLRMLLLDDVHESELNPRHHWDEKKLAELADSIREIGVIQPLLVRPKADGFEIACGHRRYRAAARAGLTAVPAIVRKMTDSEFLEVVTIENLQREDIHPLDEALGYQALMKARYHMGHLTAKTGKSETYIYSRLKLLELAEPTRTAFLSDEITLGHALLIARLQPDGQNQALHAAMGDRWDGKMSVKHLSDWIQREILCELSVAPWQKGDAALYPDAGSCNGCQKRTGANPELFPEVKKKDNCTDPGCYQQKMSLWIARKRTEIEEAGGKVALVADSYSVVNKGKGILTRDKWWEIPKGDGCEFVQNGIVVEGGSAIGRVINVCIDPKCKKHAGHTGQAASLQDLAARKRALREEKTRLEVARATMAALMNEVRAPMGTEVLRLLAAVYWDRLWHDSKREIMARRGLMPALEKQSWGGKTKDYTGPMLAAIETMDPDGLAGLLVEMALSAVDKKYLTAALAIFEVDGRKIQKDIRARAAEKRKARGAKTSKAAREKLKVDKKTGEACL